MVLKLKYIIKLLSKQIINFKINLYLLIAFCVLYYKPLHRGEPLLFFEKWSGIFYVHRMLIFYVHRMLICQPAGTGVYEARAGGGGGGDDDEAPLNFLKWTFWTKTSNIWAKPLDLGASAGEYSFGRETSAPPPPNRTGHVHHSYACGYSTTVTIAFFVTLLPPPPRRTMRT